MVAELAAMQREQMALFRHHWDQQQYWSKHRMQTTEKSCRQKQPVITATTIRKYKNILTPWHQIVIFFLDLRLDVLLPRTNGPEKVRVRRQDGCFIKGFSVIRLQFIYYLIYLYVKLFVLTYLSFVSFHFIVFNCCCIVRSN